ncbi:G patch domain-containing protein 1 [Hyperolius riggenbachi]|uniref:G patch domain-containing protein 1 n=1 Tax=Hyperolius riggenbachi TaxID=752182 RepID=UPI0035A38939
MAASESEEEEDFVTYGKPLDQYEEGEQPKKPVPIQDQTVRDEKGRYKRFHGAFTGGFSAGYFNTVGTKEGWAPSTFVSSRQGRAEKHASRPEDFMDEEDLGEFGIAPKEILTTDDFASKTKDKIQEKARELAAVAAPIPGATILEDLIAPAKITVGVQLLRQMGWKEGQGVGPRIKRKARKQDSGVKTYGCALPPTGSENSEDEDDEYIPDDITFAPKDVMPIDFSVKDNVHGLGYQGLDPRQALFGSSDSHFSLFSDGSDKTFRGMGSSQPTRGRKVGMSGQAFGVGALEDEDDDIYGTDSLSKYDTVLKEESGDGLFGWTAPKEYKNKKVSSKELQYVGKMLDGFSIATEPAPSKKVYPAPELPKNYQPVHYFRPVLKPNVANSAALQAMLEASQNPPAEQQKEQLPSRHQLTSAQRREMLGETPLQGPSSVLDLLSDKDRERITDVRQSLEEHRLKAQKLAQEALKTRFQASAEDEALKRSQDELLDRRLVPQNAAEFRPFEKNSEKQKRYENYIRALHEGHKDALDGSLDPSMTEWERSREREEFMRSAMLYKPTNTSLSSRFTRGKYEDDSDKVEVQRDEEGDMNDKNAAVKMKMFGKLTRDTFEWHPDMLLCKRFNIPDPYPGSTLVGLPKVKRDKYSVFNFLTIPEPQPPAASTARPERSQQSVESKQKKSSRWDMSSAEEKKQPVGQFVSQVKNEKEDEVEDKKMEPPASAASSSQVPLSQTDPEAAEEEEEEKRPPMDLFKAIFADSSDENSSSSEEEDSDEEETPALRAEPGTSGREPLPPSKIQDLEPRVPPPVPSAVPKTDNPEKMDSEEEFGPRLPPPATAPAPQTSSNCPSASRQESFKKQKHKKHKDKEHKHKKEKKKKHKKQKHKNKHKSKKTKEDITDSEDSSPDPGDKEQAANLTPRELLRRLKNLPIPR